MQKRLEVLVLWPGRFAGLLVGLVGNAFPDQWGRDGATGPGPRADRAGGLGELQHIVRRGSTSSVRFRRAMMLLGPGKPPRPTVGDLPPYPRNHLLPRLLLRRRRPAPGRNRERKGIDHAWAALRTIRAARPDGAPIYVILDNLSAHLNWRILVMDDGHRVRRLPGHGIDRPAPQKSRTPTPARPGGGQHRTSARPPRVEHTFARMKNWKILRDCRQKGDGLHHAVQAVATLHNLAMTG